MRMKRAKRAKLDKDFKNTKEKVIDIEDRQRRSNLCVIGVLKWEKQSKETLSALS